MCTREYLGGGCGWDGCGDLGAKYMVCSHTSVSKYLGCSGVWVDRWVAEGSEPLINLT